jgi:gamma-glutamyl:cysteine ligase YbdK (ATP-grasp superfamily)
VDERRVPAQQVLIDLLDVARGHAEQLGCDGALEHLQTIAVENGAQRPLRFARRHELPGLAKALADRFAEPGGWY